MQLSPPTMSAVPSPGVLCPWTAAWASSQTIWQLSPLFSCAAFYLPPCVVCNKMSKKQPTSTWPSFSLGKKESRLGLTFSGSFGRAVCEIAPGQGDWSAIDQAAFLWAARLVPFRRWSSVLQLDPSQVWTSNCLWRDPWGLDREGMCCWSVLFVYSVIHVLVIGCHLPG